MTPPRFAWRRMAPADIDAVVEIAAIVHPGFPESRAVLAEKRALHPQGAFLLEIGGQPAGYLLSHPWSADAIPPLDSLLGTLPEDATSYYLHDLALLPLARGSGAAAAIVADIARHAATSGFAEMALCAVNGSLGFWQKQGFAVREVPQLADKLMVYEPDARLMVRPL